MGGVDYIYKPVNPELLRAKVSVFVELYRKNLQLQLQERKLLNANKSLNREIEERKITEQKIHLLNLQLTKNNEHLKQVNEELDQFAFMASHDLQEPLRKIQMFSDKIVGKKNLDEEGERFFSKIISASRRMQSLINNLLEFSRQSLSASNFKKTDLNLLLRETLSELEVNIEKSNAQISITEMPVISAVPGLIQQLFHNILSNAIKFRKADEPLHIEISSQKVSEDELPSFVSEPLPVVYHKISIRDNGIGFDNKHGNEIFKVFKRLHSYQEFEGTGVGLAICKKIIEKHGGAIVAEGQPGEGSTFTIVLPELQRKPEHVRV
jgi:light-regulated signal transduction histidine kinase (bacteriophytochrome)